MASLKDKFECRHCSTLICGWEQASRWKPGPRWSRASEPRGPEKSSWSASLIAQGPGRMTSSHLSWFLKDASGDAKRSWALTRPLGKGPSFLQAQTRPHSQDLQGRPWQTQAPFHPSPGPRKAVSTAPRNPSPELSAPTGHTSLCGSMGTGMPRLQEPHLPACRW